MACTPGSSVGVVDLALAKLAKLLVMALVLMYVGAVVELSLMMVLMALLR